MPVFSRYLDMLAGLVNLAESHARTHGLDFFDILEVRLVPDMLPFEVQVQIAANFALRACFPLAGQAVPPYGEFPATFEGLRSRISRARTLVKQLQPAYFRGAESRTVQDQAGQAMVSLPAPNFLFHYAIPNFFFHVTAVYAILRKLGVALSKAHFDGFHSYPPPSQSTVGH